MRGVLSLKGPLRLTTFVFHGFCYYCGWRFWMISVFMYDPCFYSCTAVLLILRGGKLTASFWAWAQLYVCFFLIKVNKGPETRKGSNETPSWRTSLYCLHT
ncbi:unnamed protein product, partial [Choristocarpus tenellus]